MSAPPSRGFASRLSAEDGYGMNDDANGRLATQLPGRIS